MGASFEGVHTWRGRCCGDGCGYCVDPACGAGVRVPAQAARRRQNAPVVAASIPATQLQHGVPALVTDLDPCSPSNRATTPTVPPAQKKKAGGSRQRWRAAGGIGLTVATIPAARRPR